MTAIGISNFTLASRICKLKIRVNPTRAGRVRGYHRRFSKTRLRASNMSELENGLNKLLEEHQHESGLHVIGGRRKLMDRLVQFFEDYRPDYRPEDRPQYGADRSH
jgi:hypothetical protein